MTHITFDLCQIRKKYRVKVEVLLLVQTSGMLKINGHQLLLYLWDPMGFPRAASGKEPACQSGDIWDAGSIHGLGRSPGGGHCNPLQYSCLESPMDRYSP